ncbi:ABC transporter substrate-binding protein [Paenibacillus solani]|uniref:Ferrichrome-binding protein n=1 Tax=Paenibacillus solani TaxID=1705565 RepID=A0A0M1P6M9_9BACL|nr:ABC transporter substrate-binding protein [Paenibacillus solani]KOR89699.1 ferrichrome-binding protein [Paenibacillus solani]
MKTTKKFPLTISILTLMSLMLMACNGSSEPAPVQQDTAGTTIQPTTRSNDPLRSEADKGDANRSYTDYKGHHVEIPVSPKRIIFSGETYSDLFALSVQAIGTDMDRVKGSVYEDKTQNVEDIGFPISYEKVLALNPDLIIVANPDETAYEQLSKIAPTLMFDTFAPLEQRLPELGDILGKKPEAEQWVTDYQAKADAMWQQLKSVGMQPDETASVFTYYPGDRLFVMASTGLSQVLYHPSGFKPTPNIQQLLDEETGFKEISMEKLPEFAGDRIFILNPVQPEAQKSTQDMMNSPIWANLPAVKAGYVYTIDIAKSGSDAATREWLLQELPKMITNN